MFHWADFHFLRPAWLLLLPISALIYFLPLWQQAMHSSWAKVIEPHLLSHLLLGSKSNKPSFFKGMLLPLFIIFLSLALAGPTVEKIPSDVSFNKAPLIICLELSDQMLSQDISPNRLKRATFKIEDLLKKYRGAQVALIAFAGDAHVVVPLTDDYNTLLLLLKTLTPDLMPIKGVNLKSALAKALPMVKRNPEAVVLVMSSSDFDQDKKILKESDISMIFWEFKEEIAKKSLSSNESLVMQLSFTPDMRDVNAIVTRMENNKRIVSKRDLFFDNWFDLGPYFLAIAMGFFLIAFFFAKERWWLCCFLLFLPTPPLKASVIDWFLRKDQQAQIALEDKNPKKAAELFQDDLRKGAAYYQAKMYDEAITHFNKVNSSDGRYNLGNALAQKKHYKEAIDAYDQALKLNPNNEDAKANKELIEKLLKKQEQQQNQDKESKEKEDQSENKESKPEEQQPKEGKEKENKENQESKEQQEQKQQEQEKSGQKKAEEKKEEPSGAPKPSSNESKEKQNGEQKPEKLKAGNKSGEEGLDKETRYYFDQLEQNNSRYLKRKFLYESQKSQE